MTAEIKCKWLSLPHDGTKSDQKVNTTDIHATLALPHSKTEAV